MIYAELTAALQRAESPLDAAECHGLLCGMLCRPRTASRGAFVGEVLPDAEPGSVAAHQAGRLLDELYGATEAQLEDPARVPAPLLPDDDRPVAERSRALVAWSEGFLYGLGLGAGSAQLTGEADEFVHDVSEITRLDTDAVAGSDEDEVAFQELLEYLRVGMLLVWESARGRRAGERLH